MTPTRKLWALAVTAALLGGSTVAQAQTAPPAAPPGAADVTKPREIPSFGTLKTVGSDAAKAQAEAWLKGAGKTDEAAQKAFAEIWASDRVLLDKVADTLALGDPEAKALLSEVKAATAAPVAVPAALKDARRPAFYRANLALAYGRALSNRRVYEEALEALNLARPENVVDPATHLFHKAVAEHALAGGDFKKAKEANNTIIRLLDDVTDSPERYKRVAALMVFDMLSWQDKDLGAIARKMDNIGRRLDLARGGKVTQKQQKEVLARLDELIKEKENQANGSSAGNGGQCPNGGQQPGNQPGNGTPTSPQRDSMGGQNSGPGNVDPKKLKEMAEVWGKLPEKERAKAMLELTRDMPPRYREVIEKYFKELARSGTESGSR